MYIYHPMNTFTVNEASAKLFQLLNEVAHNHKPILITGEYHNAVLISHEDWEAIQETLYLLSIPDMRESIQAGLATPITECEKELEW